jgi:hypothetical protein
MLMGLVWLASHGDGEESPAPSGPPQFAQAPLDYTIAVEAHRVRLSGTANLPNGVILLGTLDKIGLGVLEVREALVMNRTFAMEFGPDLRVQYPGLEPEEALTPGAYRLSVTFDPGRQSPFVRESLLSPAATQGGTAHEPDPALIRVARIFTIGTPEALQEAEAREQQRQRTVRHHLDETLGRLKDLWQRLRAQYQQERSQGAFQRSDPRAQAWQAWSAQWLEALKALGEQQRLHEAVSPATPYHLLYETLLAVYRQLPSLRDLYSEVLLNERPPDDPELQRVELQLYEALRDAIAQLGRREPLQPVLPVESPKATVTIAAPMVNVRSGPGMSHNVLSLAKRDDAFDLLGEHGEWLHIKLPSGRGGWVHRNVASKSPTAAGTTAEPKGSEARPIPADRHAALIVEPIALQATPLAYVPRPTADEFRIYADIEEQLRALAMPRPEDRSMAEQRMLQRLSEKYGLSPKQLWGAYLKVQGWEIKP